MNNVVVFLYVAASEWDYENNGYNEFARKSFTFYRNLQLPFAPFIGLQLQDQNWITNPLKQVRYQVDDKKFVCHVESDMEIANECDKKFYDNYDIEENLRDKLAEKYIEEEAKFKHDFYISLGWNKYK